MFLVPEKVSLRHRAPVFISAIDSQEALWHADPKRDLRQPPRDNLGGCLADISNALLA